MLGLGAVALREKTLESPYRDGAIDIPATSGGFTGMSTNPAADTRERIRIAGKLVSFLKAPFRNERNVTPRVGVGGASHHAGKVGI